MNVAVDTNVFVRLLSGDEETVLILQKAVEAAAARGLLVVSPIVYAELAAGRDYRAVDDFFSAKDLDEDWQQGPKWREAGTCYGRYARDRRRQRGDPGATTMAISNCDRVGRGLETLRAGRLVRRAGAEGPPERRLAGSGRSCPRDEHGWDLYEVLPRE